MTHVLVAFASKRGGTAGLATMIGDALAEARWEVTVSPAEHIHDLTGFDAVVVAACNLWLPTPSGCEGLSCQSHGQDQGRGLAGHRTRTPLGGNGGGAA